MAPTNKVPPNPKTKRPVEEVEFVSTKTRRGKKFVERTPVANATPTPSSAPSTPNRNRTVVIQQEDDSNNPTDDVGGFHDNPLDEFVPRRRIGQVGDYHLCKSSSLYSRRTQTQQDVLREGLAHRDEVISHLLAAENLPEGTVCNCCNNKAALYRCTSCIGMPVMCLDCCNQLHQWNPFHTIQEWRDGFFQKVDLQCLGYTIYMGHRGLPCPTSREDSAGAGVRFLVDDDLTLVDICGVFRHRVSWCNCQNRESTANQLIAMGLFPATLKNPKTAFTFAVLDHFYLDFLECHTSAQSFYTKLRRLTNNVDPKSVPVRLGFPPSTNTTPSYCDS